ncbi:alpha-ketoglutarate-dependent dioxygenase alkB homolog 7, mitochondrial [Planococcus citri]|uniref:alpha-ketoglutarate-dependent dioxygenase alkB homolog 7, mitochondrial n=1 Tax=Planococcus citri TaxID=170843 RepID=UPI0031FA12FC
MFKNIILKFTIKKCIPIHPPLSLTKYSTQSNTSSISSNIPFNYDISAESHHYTDVFLRDMTIVPDFISETEENALFDEAQTDLRSKRYEYDHWDDAIIGFRELERLQWNTENQKIIERVRKFAFPPSCGLIHHVHVLDLHESGYIKPHVDSVKFCGNTIAGISLLSDSIMRLIMEENKSIKLDVLLPRRSLYIMRDDVRFKFTHEILKKDESVFKGMKIDRGRRISIICRNEVSN